MNPLLPGLLRVAICLLLACPVVAQSYTFTHLAGTAGGPGFEDGTGSVARFAYSGYLAGDAAGNVYVADGSNQTIRKITAAGEVSTVAGLAGTPPHFVDGLGVAARFNNPTGMAVHPDGSIYVADSHNHIIRKIDAGGRVTTFAGNTVFGSVDGTGSAARFNSPGDIAIAPDGTLYVCDTLNHTIRRITAAGVVTTIAGSPGSTGWTDGTGNQARFTYPEGIEVDPQGNLYVADLYGIRKVTPAGVVTTLAGAAQSYGGDDGTGDAARFDSPMGIAIDATGTAYVADTYNHTIRKVTAGGVVTTFAGLAGNAGIIDGTGQAARFQHPIGITFDSAGNLVVTSSNAIRRITTAGVVTTLAGLSSSRGAVDDTGTAARFNEPVGIAVDVDNNVFVSDAASHTIRKITPAGTVSTFAGLAGSAGSQNGTGSAARFHTPFGLAVDASRNVFVADALNHSIRKITPLQAVTTFAGTNGEFLYPGYVALDSAGNTYVSDDNHLIRKIASDGTVTTLAGQSGVAGSQDGTGTGAAFHYPSGLAVDGAGNVYVADSANHTIRKITSAGVVTTLAGMAGFPGIADGTGTAARFNRPTGLAIDGAGNLFVTDAYSDRVRMVTAAGVVTTLTTGLFDANPAARLQEPYGIAIDGAGNLYVTDRYNHAIRKGSPALSDVATIDATTGYVGSARQLSTTTQNATGWTWELIRKPAGSAAQLSSTTIRNPTFTPDVADLFVLRLTATNGVQSSISTVSLMAGAATTTTLSISTTAADCTSARTLTATVSSALAGTIGGTVAFKDAGRLLANVPLSGGQASLTLSLPPNQYLLFAEFSGDATYNASDSGAWAHQVLSKIPAAPTGLQATATSVAQVNLSWTADSCATHFEVWRRSTGGYYAIAAPTTTSFVDTAVTADAAYVYMVRALNGAGTSPDSVRDAATTVMFTDDPVTAGSTAIKGAHVSQLRVAVNALRATAGLTPFTFTDSTLLTTTFIRAAHFSDLRSAVDAARAALDLPAITFTDAFLAAQSTSVKAVHLQELRSAVK